MYNKGNNTKNIKLTVALHGEVNTVNKQLIVRQSYNYYAKQFGLKMRFFFNC